MTAPHELGRWIADARRITALTGAGISTDSGIPDYRGPNGVWTRDPRAERLSTYADYVNDPDVRREAWRRRLEHPAWTAAPNAAHRALVDLERSGRLVAIVTQNIDELHQRAGSAASRVIELHGTVWHAECVPCGARTAMADELERVRGGDPDPRCRRCGGIVKSATISFGQRLDPAVVRAAVAAAASCDVFLAIGSSLTVQPAAGLCDVAVEAGARLVIVNAQATPYDGLADAIVRTPIGEAVPRLIGAVERVPGRC